WLCEPPAGAALACEAKIRYRHAAVLASVTALPDGGARVWFAQPQSAVTPGQAVVFYHGPRVLGGGWIETALAAGGAEPYGGRGSAAAHRPLPRRPRRERRPRRGPVGVRPFPPRGGPPRCPGRRGGPPGRRRARHLRPVPLPPPRGRRRPR